MAAGIRNLLKKLPVVEIVEAVEIAHRKFGRPCTSAEKYFFGVCRRKIAERNGPFEFDDE